MSQIKEPHKAEDLVEVQHLVKYFPVRAGLMQRVVNWVKAVDDISFTVKKGETIKVTMARNGGWVASVRSR